MIFDPCNCPLKIQKSIGTPTAKVGVHLGVWGFIPSHFLIVLGAWNATPKLHSWPTPLQALAFVVNPRLRLRQLIYMFEQLQCLNGEFNCTSSFYKTTPFFPKISCTLVAYPWWKYFSINVQFFWSYIGWSIKVESIILSQLVGLSIMGHGTKHKLIICEQNSKIIYYMWYDHTVRISWIDLIHHDILDFWSAKNLMLESISYDYGFFIFIKKNWMIFWHKK
jgi:hypothetical protein